MVTNGGAQIQALERRLSECTAELVLARERYAGLFEVSNMTYAEMDFSATKPLLDQLRADGVTDLRSHMHDHPDVFARALSLIKTTRVNDALARLMKYDDVADLVANPPAQNADDGPEVLLRQLEMAWNGTSHIDGRTTLIGKKGVEIPVYYTVSRHPDGIHLSSHVDLTEQVRIEELRQAAREELARANRMATVGAFSASIAHELNQPVASMIMDAQTGRRWLKRDPPDLAAVERVLERLANTAQRIAGIVKRTRENIMSGPRSLKSVDLCRLAAETHELLQGEFKRADVRLEIRCVEGVPLVRADPVDLQQVLVNLITNAVHAMHGISCDRTITLTVVGEDKTVRVSVADNGTGIAPENIERLFNPFFTTKPGGIGMGLQICKSAVEAMGGHLVVQNRPERGAEFSFSISVSGAPQGDEGDPAAESRTFV